MCRTGWTPLARYIRWDITYVRSTLVGYSPVKVELKALTNCGVRHDGEILELNFVDAQGAPVCFQMTFNDAQAIAMTLPGLLTQALRKIAGTDKTRYAFPLGSWWLESTDKSDCLIATFATDDGFEVSFAILREACGGLGLAFQHEAESQLDLPKSPHRQDISLN